MYRCDYCDGIVEAKCISIQFQRYRHTNHSEPVTIVKMIHFTPERSSLPVIYELIWRLVTHMTNEENPQLSWYFDKPTFQHISTYLQTSIWLTVLPWRTSTYWVDSNMHAVSAWCRKWMELSWITVCCTWNSPWLISCLTWRIRS